MTDYPDRWLQAKPAAGSGAGAPRKTPEATLTATQLVLNHAASELLGNPDRVLVTYNPAQSAIRLRPTSSDDRGGFALSGGGNAQARISGGRTGAREGGREKRQSNSSEQNRHLCRFFVCGEYRNEITIRIDITTNLLYTVGMREKRNRPREKGTNNEQATIRTE